MPPTTAAEVWGGRCSVQDASARPVWMLGEFREQGLKAQLDPLGPRRLPAQLLQDRVFELTNQLVDRLQKAVLLVLEVLVEDRRRDFRHAEDTLDRGAVIASARDRLDQGVEDAPPGIGGAADPGPPANGPVIVRHWCDGVRRQAGDGLQCGGEMPVVEHPSLPLWPVEEAGSTGPSPGSIGSPLSAPTAGL